MAQIADKQFCFNYLNIRAGTPLAKKSLISGLSTNAVSLANISGGGFSYIPSGVDPFFSFSTSFSGNTGRYLVITLRKRSGNTVSSDFCQIFYETSAHGFSESYSFHKNFTPESDWTTFVCDMHNPTVGGTDWKNSTITRIRIDIGTTTGSNYDIQSVMVMQPRTWSPTGTTTQVMNMQAVAKLCDWGNAQRSLSSNYQSQSGITTQVMDITAAIRAMNKWLLTPTAHGEYGSINAGSYTWTVPAYVTSVTITLVGGGGEGGGGDGGSDASGAGGGSGYQARVTLTVDQGEVFTVSVGRGGQEASGYYGEAGVATYLYRNGTHILTASGGSGGGGGGSGWSNGGGGLCNGGSGKRSDNSGDAGSASPNSSYWYSIGSAGGGGSRWQGGLSLGFQWYAGGGGGGAGTKLTINGTTYNNQAGGGDSSGGYGGSGGTGVGAGGGGSGEPQTSSDKLGGDGNPGGFVITW